MIKTIEITVLRVSSNGKYIEFIINCPKDYYFTDFIINVYEDNENKYSLKDCLFVDHDHTQEDSVQGDDGLWYYNKHYYSGQFKIEDLDVHKPEMFEVELKAEHNEDADSEVENNLEQSECWLPPHILKTKACISDVSKIYDCLMGDILSMGSDLCSNSEATDKLIRNYLILYAHHEAMKLREFSEAKKYFVLLLNCFNHCGNTSKTCHLCNGGTMTEYVTYKPSNCNCGK